ncbi:[Fe-Fe] hydrogenase large subunit C-terminal domain-containing protein [Inediibacterium massiliense]|uniref:[Fe-Fe] hydrogenase large subunit C-terminal domain-containing protein n=1 Tax=Inediibacterium massiliense TaxID=1658111 RepID=UPI0006B56FB7|nr:[Fe-Fe] hydrogenase large subunit C-terminal domain-containing protein [Inediibacterium massiliense]
MFNEFSEFQKRRMDLLEQLVKKKWFGELKSNEELSKLEQDLKEKYKIKEDYGYVKDQIRLAMGLDPRGNMEFSDELDIIKNIKGIKPPVVTKMNDPCYKKFEDISKYDSSIYKRTKEPVIINNKCLSCGEEVSSLSFESIADKIEFIPLIDLLKDSNTEVYATVAPSIIGQFGDNITMGQIRTALKLMGFKDMIEVALFADMLTIKEAYEFNHLVKGKNDFFLTSCCCPIWVSLIEKNYPKLFEKMSPSVSPMILSGRILKKFYNKAKVVFIGPCIAKKSEAKDKRYEGDIDFVLTFRELKSIFSALDIDLKELYADEKDQASFAGRVYARTGGVSFSVKSVVNRIAPKRLIKFRSKKIDGVKECKKILDDLSMGKKIESNFIEGMGCEGGCVGGPRTNIDVKRATEIVNEFGEDSLIMTPFDNMNVMKIFDQLGIKNLKQIVEESELTKIFTR